MRLGISVVICTYNGAALLPNTLYHIAQQQVRSDIEWEIIVIDNASTDETTKVALDEWDLYKNPAKFSVLQQPIQGLTYARELALEQAAYEYVLFCDDDNWLESDYLTISYDIMNQNPAIGVLGGCGELEFEAPPPLWAVGYSAFANGPQAKISGKVSHNIVYGAGFIIRKAAFTKLSNAGFKPMLTDRKALNLSAGGDYELCYAIALAGYEIWYEGKLKFKHFMPKERICWDYCVRFFKEGSQSFEVLIPYRIRVNMGCTDLLTFNLKLAKTFYIYSKKLIPLLIQKMRHSSDSEEAKLYLLKLISLKAKILSCSNYRNIRQNFKKILEFEQESLLVHTNNKEDLKHKLNAKFVRIKRT